MEGRQIHNLNLYLKLLASLLFVSIILNLIFLATVVNTRRISTEAINDYSTKTKELDEKINLKDSDMEKIFDKYYADKLRSFIDEKDLVLLARKQWNYMLTINGGPFNGGSVNTTDKNIKLVLAEIKNDAKTLPQDILIKGTITGGDTNESLDDHFKVSFSKEYKKYEENDANGNRICYEFKNVSQGSIITIILTPILKDRLNLNDKMKPDDNKLQIIVM